MRTSAVAEPSFNCIDDARAAVHKTRWIVFHYPFLIPLIAHVFRQLLDISTLYVCGRMSSAPPDYCGRYTHNGLRDMTYTMPFVIRADGGSLCCLHEKLMSNDHPVLFVFVSVDVRLVRACISTVYCTTVSLP